MVGITAIFIVFRQIAISDSISEIAVNKLIFSKYTIIGSYLVIKLSLYSRRDEEDSPYPLFRM